MTWESFLNHLPCMKCGRCCLKVQISSDSWVWVGFVPHGQCREKQRKKKLKINHCSRATYIKLYSSFKLCFVHSILLCIWTLTVRYNLINVMHCSLLKYSNKLVWGKLAAVELWHNGISLCEELRVKAKVFRFHLSHINIYWKLNAGGAVS